MIGYVIRRICLLPVTLFAIVLLNFVILNLAPGDPTASAQLGANGEATRHTDSGWISGDHQYLLFREHYGLTLPILLNTWIFLSQNDVETALDKLIHSKKEISVQSFHKMRTLWGDRAKFVMPLLLKIAENKEHSFEKRMWAANLFVRGGLKQGDVGATLSQTQRDSNRLISQTNRFLNQALVTDADTLETLEDKISQLSQWFDENKLTETFTYHGIDAAKTFFLQTRFARYLNRVATLDFGTLRNDSNRKVIHEVGKRIKYSLTLAGVPLLLTFLLCQCFGMLMAVKQNSWIDYTLNIFFLILFATPVFVVAPFLIEKIALNKTFPFTNIPIPYSGFHSPQEVYEQLTSLQKVGDIMLHILLPIIAIKYGTIAVQARLARTAFLEVLRQDYVRTARAKGLSRFAVLFKHVGRNGAITIVTSLAASLGVILGGSLIVETLFEINGFGRFFYDAILNRDYNVVLFSAFAGSFLTLIGYLLADIAFTLLDPRVSLDDSV